MNSSEQPYAVQDVPLPRPQQRSIPAPQAAAQISRLETDYRAVRASLDEGENDRVILEKARQQLMDILRRDQQYAPAYAGLARVELAAAHLGGDRFDPQALQRARRLVYHALRLDQDLFDGHLTAAWIARYEGDFHGAATSLDLASSLRPHDSELKLVRAELAEAEKDPKEMIRLAREVIAESENRRLRGLAYGYVIRALVQAGHMDQADRAHRARLEILPRSAPARAEYAAFLLQRDRIDEALLEAERALAIRRDARTTDVLARAYLAKAESSWQQNQTGWDAYIDRVGGLASASDSVSVNLASFYERASIRGNDPALRERALASYRRALEINPRNEEAQRALSRLQPRAPV